MFDTRDGRVSSRQRSKLPTSCDTTGGSLTFLREGSRAGPRARVAASQQKHSAKHAPVYKTFKDKTAGGAEREMERKGAGEGREEGGKVFPSGRRGKRAVTAPSLTSFLLPSLLFQPNSVTTSLATDREPNRGSSRGRRRHPAAACARVRARLCLCVRECDSSWRE